MQRNQLDYPKKKRLPITSADLSRKHEFISDSICSSFLQLVLVITSDWTLGEDGYSYYEVCINEISGYDKTACHNVLSETFTKTADISVYAHSSLIPTTKPEENVSSEYLSCFLRLKLKKIHAS